MPEEYDHGKFVKIVRHSAHFKVDRSDYMQWHLYADLPDNSWRQAVSISRDNCVILDIGANCGQFSLVLAAALLKSGLSQFKIHAFEPNPYVYQLLRSNLDINPQLDQYVSCHQLAVGNEVGEIGFTFDPKNSGAGAITQAPENLGKENIKTRIDRLNNIVEALTISRIDFIKIDVEGFEPEVLAGAEKVIKEFHPWLYVEITPAWFQQRGHSADSVISKLLGWGYELLGEYNEEFLPYSENVKLFRSLHQFNVLAKPRLGE
ncbi:MAG: FkbM family methyltransferase [Bacteroidia bacterium]